MFKDISEDDQIHSVLVGVIVLFQTLLGYLVELVDGEDLRVDSVLWFSIWQHVVTCRRVGD